ncbi:MAG: hypothetical protein V8T12_04070 [Parabacteroides johnsonii]
MAVTGLGGGNDYEQGGPLEQDGVLPDIMTWVCDSSRKKVKRYSKCCACWR